MAAVAVVLLALVVGIVGTTWGMIRAQHAARGRARRRRRPCSTSSENRILAAARPEGQFGGLGRDDHAAEGDRSRTAVRGNELQASATDRGPLAVHAGRVVLLPWRCPRRSSKRRRHGTSSKNISGPTTSSHVVASTCWLAPFWKPAGPTRPSRSVKGTWRRRRPSSAPIAATRS